MRSTLLALLALQAAAVSVERKGDDCREDIAATAAAAATSIPMLLNWWEAISEDGQRVTAVNALDAWASYAGPAMPYFTVDQAACAWIKARGSSLAWLKDAETTQCELNWSESAAMVVAAGMANLDDCDPMEIAELRKCNGVAEWISQWGEESKGPRI